MTVKQFCDDLNAVKDRLQWHTTPDGHLRCNQIGRRVSYCCPITALCNVHGFDYAVNEAKAAGIRLGLSHADIRIIMDSADNRKTVCPHSSHYNKGIRASLLNATGLNGDQK